MLRRILAVLAVVATTFSAQAGYSLKEIQNLRNDKEVIITSIKKAEKKRIREEYKDAALIKTYSDLFYKTVQNFVNTNDGHCELKLLSDLHQKLKLEKIADSEEEIEEYLKVLRVNHSIDDIFLDILTSVNKDYFEMMKINLDKKARRMFFSHKKLIAANDLKTLFAPFEEFPDEKDRCMYQTYKTAYNSVLDKDDEKAKSKRDFKVLTVEAFKGNLISLSTFNKLVYLNSKSTLNKRDVWLVDYLKIILSAKNKMIPVKSNYKPRNIEDEDDFSSERVKRFSQITRRRLLYRKYDETQIILLAQVLQKASRRMGVDSDTVSKKPVISQEFTITKADGEKENLVETIELDPQSQFNLARRLLRKDVMELQRMDAFIKTTITHEDVIMAAFETGYISLEEIEFVIKYDDLWNPNISKFEKITGFVFKVTGFSTIFIPPPWNIVTAIALGVVEGVVDNKFNKKKGAANDNPATFIE